jgi:hypothetical protein
MGVSIVAVRSLSLLLKHPLGLALVFLQVVAVTICTAGIMLGPMLVGFYRVLLKYVRQNTWAPEELWGHATRHNLTAGIVFAAMHLAVFLFGLPLASTSPLLAGLFNFCGAVAVALLWFYTFPILSDKDQPWVDALRAGWHKVQRSNLVAHVALVGLLNTLRLLPSDSGGIALQLVLLLLIGGFSALAQTTAYTLVAQPTKLSADK